jgi:hypothetical protein
MKPNEEQNKYLQMLTPSLPVTLRVAHLPAVDQQSAILQREEMNRKQFRYIQGTAKGGKMHYLATEDRTMSSKCIQKEKYFVLSWHATIQPWLDMTVWKKQW